MVANNDEILANTSMGELNASVAMVTLFRKHSIPIVATPGKRG